MSEPGLSAAAASSTICDPPELASAAIPLSEDDLTADEHKTASGSRLPLALAKAIHRKAVALGRDSYIDPQTGYMVFTALFLKRRPCCGGACRHCPHGHVNVRAGRRPVQPPLDEW